MDVWLYHDPHIIAIASLSIAISLEVDSERSERFVKWIAELAVNETEVQGVRSEECEG
jgi:hypothetical protein